MVKGLDIFRVHFQNFAHCYVLIGGAACDIAMTNAGLPFRATKDLDIVLCVEALDAAFVQAFWAFVRAGNYQAQEKSTGQKLFYRFHKPANESYPFMLELFSRLGRNGSSRYPSRSRTDSTRLLPSEAGSDGCLRLHAVRPAAVKTTPA